MSEKNTDYYNFYFMRYTELRNFLKYTAVDFCESGLSMSFGTQSNARVMYMMNTDFRTLSHRF